MKSIFRYIITPKKSRYNNTVELENGGELIVNTDISNHQFISREGIVLSTPLAYDTPIKVGDTVITHHQIFRRWFDMKGKERNSSWFMEEDRYAIYHDQIFAYKSEGGDWKGFDEFCFVLPVKNKDNYRVEQEAERKGIVFVANDALRERGIKEGDVVGFTASSEYEFVVDNQLCYRMKDKNICLLYPDAEEEVYNPNWARG